MLNNIFKKEKFINEQDHNEIVARLESRISSLLSERTVLRADIAALREFKDLFPVSLGDPIPSDTETRKMYVAQVAGFFKDVFQDKLHYMISNIHNLLEDVSNDRDTDNMLKGSTYILRELIRWGNAMVNEQIAYQTEIPQSQDEDIQTLQNSLKN